jgi:hypothetical protein
MGDAAFELTSYEGTIDQLDLSQLGTPSAGAVFAVFTVFSVSGEVQEVQASAKVILQVSRGGVPDDDAVDTGQVRDEIGKDRGFRSGGIQPPLVLGLVHRGAEEPPSPLDGDRWSGFAEPAAHFELHAEEVVVTIVERAHDLPGDPGLVGDDEQRPDLVAKVAIRLAKGLGKQTPIKPSADVGQRVVSLISDEL